MINKKRALYLLNEYGDAIVDFVGRKDSIVVTSDFNNKYIRSIKRTQRFSLKGNILVFSWTDNEFTILPIKEVRNITPLANVLGNTRDGEVEKVFRKTKATL